MFPFDDVIMSALYFIGTEGNDTHKNPDEYDSIDDMNPLGTDYVSTTKQNETHPWASFTEYNYSFAYSMITSRIKYNFAHCPEKNCLME